MYSSKIITKLNLSKAEVGKIYIDCIEKEEISNWIGNMKDAVICIKKIDVIELHGYAIKIITKLTPKNVKNFLIVCNNQEHIKWLFNINLNKHKVTSSIINDFLVVFDIFIQKLINEYFVMWKWPSLFFTKEEIEKEIEKLENVKPLTFQEIIINFFRIWNLNIINKVKNNIFISYTP